MAWAKCEAHARETFQKSLGCFLIRLCPLIHLKCHWEPYCIAWLATCREIGGKLSIWREEGFNGLSSGDAERFGDSYNSLYWRDVPQELHCTIWSFLPTQLHTPTPQRTVTQLQGLAYTNTSLLEGYVNLPDVWFNLSVGPLCPDTEELVEPAEQICYSTQEYHHYSDSSSSNQW